MGIYLNPGNVNFKRCLNSEIYVDKTKLITFTNKVINTQQRYLCVSRPRRFGKSMAADMLAAYYGCRQDSTELFVGLQALWNKDAETVAAGKGYADICLLPKQKAVDKPAVLFELKYNKSVKAAMAQIKEKQYPDAFAAYHGKLLLCGMNYNKNTKQHECSIALWEK